MVQKHLQQPVHVVAYIVPNKNWYIATKLIVTMNSFMGMIVLVGVETATASWTLTVTTLAMLANLTGTDYIGEPTPWHNQTKPRYSYYQIQPVFQNMISTPTKPRVSAKKKPMVTFFLTGTGK